VKFLPDGPDIPGDLIAAQERGEVIFVSGAGISKMAGLPLFRGLVEDVYRRLGQDWRLHPAERELMDGRQGGQYDRVLRCLERRLLGSDPNHSRGMRERIRNAVRESLKPLEGSDLTNHAALLKLSRNASDEVRLVTTNFDTLFERSGRGRSEGEIASHAGAAIPQPKSARCTGVLHLHGRLQDDSLSLVETDLVLTSADFGDAYLRAGWASRYVYDLVRAYTVVLVGYEADDPPMRYLLEALEADRERFPDLQRVFAFASCELGKEGLQTEIWKAKGVDPILYSVNGEDHSALYATIREWQRYAEDPSVWRKEQLRPLLEREPKDLDDDDMSRCIDLLSHGDASQQLRELSPSANWLPVLMQKRAFDKARTTPGEWIAGRIDDPHMIKACAGVMFVDDEARWYVERALEREKETLSDVRKKAWRLILASNLRSSTRRIDERWFRIMGRIRKDHAEFATRRTLSELLRPTLDIGQPLSVYHELEDDEGPERLQSLVRISFEPERYADPEEILKKWPRSPDSEAALFVALARALSDALEEAEDVTHIGEWDHADNDVPSVGRHPQNAHRHGFYPIVRVLADLWDRIASDDPRRMRRYIDEWSTSRFLLLKRLALYAMTDSSFTSADVTHLLTALDDETYWVGSARVEIMRLIVSRWNTLEAADRETLELRIRGGVPRDIYIDGDLDFDARWKPIHDSSIYRRLARLESAGCQLSEAGRALLADISARNPSWRPSKGDRDDFGTWFESSWGPSGHPERLKDVLDEDLVQAAIGLQRERSFEESDVWRMLCASDPERALRALIIEADKDRWEPTAWRHLMWEVGAKSDSRIVVAIATKLLDMPEEHIRELLGTATSWLQTHGETLSSAKLDDGDVFLKLWDLLANLTYTESESKSLEDDDDKDLSTRALNRPGGQLAWALRERLMDAKPQKDGGFGADMEPRLTRAVLAEGNAGLLARVHLMRWLSVWDLIAPEWTARHMLPRLEWTHPEAPAMWRAYAQDRIRSARLFNALKPAMLEAFKRTELEDHDVEDLIAKMIFIGIWHRRGEGAEYLLDDGEIRRILMTGPRTILQYASWHFWRLMAEANDEMPDKAARWRTVVGPLFRDVWPLDANLRSESVSSNLVEMAVECESDFPDAVNAIVDVVVPFEIHKISLSLKLEPHHASLPKEHPSTFLRLLNAVIDPDKYRIPSDLAEVLQECSEANPAVKDEPAYRRLFGLKRLRGA